MYIVKHFQQTTYIFSMLITGLKSMYVFFLTGTFESSSRYFSLSVESSSNSQGKSLGIEDSALPSELFFLLGSEHLIFPHALHSQGLRSVGSSVVGHVDLDLVLGARLLLLHQQLDHQAGALIAAHHLLHLIRKLLLEFFNLLLPGESRSQMRGDCKDEGPGIVSFPELFV